MCQLWSYLSFVTNLCEAVSSLCWYSAADALKQQYGLNQWLWCILCGLWRAHLNTNKKQADTLVEYEVYVLYFYVNKNIYCWPIYSTVFRTGCSMQWEVFVSNSDKYPFLTGHIVPAHNSYKHVIRVALHIYKHNFISPTTVLYLCPANTRHRPKSLGRCLVFARYWRISCMNDIISPYTI